MPSNALLVAWYGSFEGAGTIGDLFALKSVVRHLVGLGLRVRFASAFPVAIDGATRVDLREVSPDDYRLLVFVCGPMLAQLPQTRALFKTFASVRKIGVGVSLLPNGHFNHCNPFDKVLAREGADEAFEDVAVLAPDDVYVAEGPCDGPPVVGVALRGPQSEYGADICEWARTAALADAVARHLNVERGWTTIQIENHLYSSGLSPAEIVASYRRCRLVVTSRFHGAIMALRSGVPFIAIDQIRGGAKVHNLLAGAGWPHVYRVEGLDERIVIDAAEEALSGALDFLLDDTRRRTRERAGATLDALTGLLVDWREAGFIGAAR